MQSRISARPVLVAALLSTAALAADGTTTGPQRRNADAGRLRDADAGGRGEDQGRRLFTAALVWHEMSEYTNAVDRGAQDEFARLGIEVVGQTDAGFDAARQKSDVETVMAKKPSIILSLPVDPATAAAVYKPALEAGVKLAFVDNSPTGYVQGKDYVTIVSDDLFQMGKKAGDAMAAALGNKGKVGYIFHDADFYVTNQRDGAFKATIEQDYPGHEDRRRGGHGRPGPGRGNRAGHADPEPRSRRHLRHLGRAGAQSCSRRSARPATPTPRSSRSISTSPPRSTWCKGGNVAAIVADEAYDIGRTAARAAAGSAARQERPRRSSSVDSLAVTKDNVARGLAAVAQQGRAASVADAVK